MDSKTKENKPTSTGSPTGSPKKKKRCRIRNRPRNKRNRQLLESTIKNQSISVTNEKEEKNLNQIEKIVHLKENLIAMQPTTEAKDIKVTIATGANEKTREEILAEREAKKLAKQAKKTKQPTGSECTNVAISKLPITPAAVNSANIVNNDAAVEKSRDQIKAEREAKKQLKQAAKTDKVNKVEESVGEVTQQLANFHITGDNSTTDHDIKKKPALTKAERRAIQEAQRAAKAQAQLQAQKKTPAKLPLAATISQAKPKATAVPSNIARATSPTKAAFAATKECKVKLFNHLESNKKNVNLFVNNPQIHPSIARLGEQYAKRTVVGSNARCIAFMNALKLVIQDFETPPKKEFARSLEAIMKISVEHLQNCRPLAVSVSNAFKHIKHVLTQLPTDKPESELKEHLCYFIDTYIENQIDKAAQAISSSMQEKINDGDVILTFGCSSLINYICEEAQSRKVDFRVIVVDSRPFCEGQELLRRLTAKEIPCTYVLINAVGFVMPEVTKVLLGAHALLSNGYVMARTGTAQVALVANSFNVPVLVCCETHKFSERFQTDAIVYNELGDPHNLVLSEKCCLTNWQSKNKMTPLNLIYDITPPELVTAVVTEVSVLPCTSVPVILRIKPTEIGYYS